MTDAYDHDDQLQGTNNPSLGAEYEEITSDEVDRVIEALEKLMAGTSSENIRTYLEEAADRIFDLVYASDAEVISESHVHDQAA